ncbi:MAG TPA: hypothetical protein VKC56_11460 [Gallionellaceae bacterium]|nr:hypothetical protein [Gallionellaceae bacterium]
MSMTQNLLYAAVQVAHNFGAVSAVGGSAAGWALKDTARRRKLAWLTSAGWLTQALSGAAFGAVSYAYYHRFPDLGEIPIGALVIKMTCVAAALLLFAYYILRARRRSGETRATFVWPVSLVLAATALTAAAVLRWFS